MEIVQNIPTYNAIRREFMLDEPSMYNFQTSSEWWVEKDEG